MEPEPRPVMRPLLIQVYHQRTRRLGSACSIIGSLLSYTENIVLRIPNGGQPKRERSKQSETEN